MLVCSVILDKRWMMTSQEVEHDDGSERKSLLPHWISRRLKNKRSMHWNHCKVFFNIYLISGHSGVVFSRWKTFRFLVKEACSRPNVIEFLAGNQQTDGFENWFYCWLSDKLVNDWMLEYRCCTFEWLTVQFYYWNTRKSWLITLINKS